MRVCAASRVYDRGGIGGDDRLTVSRSTTTCGRSLTLLCFDSIAKQDGTHCAAIVIVLILVLVTCAGLYSAEIYITVRVRFGMLKSVLGLAVYESTHFFTTRTHRFDEHFVRGVRGVVSL